MVTHDVQSNAHPVCVVQISVLADSLVETVAANKTCCETLEILRMGT